MATVESQTDRDFRCHLASASGSPSVNRDPQECCADPAFTLPMVGPQHHCHSLQPALLALPDSDPVLLTCVWASHLLLRLGRVWGSPRVWVVNAHRANL